MYTIFFRAVKVLLCAAVCFISFVCYNISYIHFESEVIPIKDLKKLAAWLNEAIAGFDGTWSYIVHVKDGEDEAKIACQETHVHRSASMIKVLILAALCAGEISFAEKMRIDSVPRAEGGGALQEMNGDAELTVRALASLMIVLSDNLATNLLISRLGMDYINSYARQIGLADTKLRRAMMDFAAAEAGRENTMSAADCDRLLWHIYGRKDEPRFAEAWRILGRQQFRDRLPYHWDEGIIFHHKTGMLDGAEHDGGILEGKNGTCSIIVFASDLPSNSIGGIQIGRLGEYIYNYLEKS